MLIMCMEMQKNKIISIKNVFKLKEENEEIKDRIIEDIRTLFK